MIYGILSQYCWRRCMRKCARVRRGFTWPPWQAIVFCKNYGQKKYMGGTYTHIKTLDELLKWGFHWKLMRSIWHHKHYYNPNQRSKYTMHDFILMEYQKYPSITILKHVNVLAELNELHYVNWFNMMPYQKCTFLQSTYKKWTYGKLLANKRCQIQFSNK